MRTTFGSQPFLLRAAMLALALALAGCAAVLPRLGAAIDGADAECLAWYDRLDAEIEKAGVRDAEEARITGLPFLRINRLAAALAQRASGSDEAFDVWLTLLSRLDGQARRVEIVGPAKSIFSLSPNSARSASVATQTADHVDQRDAEQFAADCRCMAHTTASARRAKEGPPAPWR